MQKFFLAMLLCLAMAVQAVAATGSNSLMLDKGVISLLREGKTVSLPEPFSTPSQVTGADLQFVGFGENDAGIRGIKAGLYLFKGRGAPVAFLPGPDAEFCAAVQLSPDGKVLAVDSGTWLVRDWAFFSWPNLRPMGSVAYYDQDSSPPLVWTPGGVLFTSITGNSGRTCDYDPCGPTSVVYLNFAAGKKHILLAGTDLCNYTARGLQSDGITASVLELCLPSVSDWATPPSEKFEKNKTVTLP